MDAKPVWSSCGDLELADGIEGLVRKALQWIVEPWNGIFDVAEEMNIDFCLYVSPFPSTMSTARHLHADALPLKDFVYCPLRGRRTIRSSRYRSLKVGES